MRGLALRLSLFAATAALLACCKNQPVEPSPSPRMPETSSVRVPSAAAPRCLVPLSSVAPQPAEPVVDFRCPRESKPERRYRKRPLKVGRASLVVELALSEPEREQGLMYRRALGEEEGMLFDLEVEEPHAFWMHDTCIPLDIAFLASDGTVVGIAENAPPLNDEPRQVACPSRYVLEVPAGWFRRHGAAPGMRIAVTE